MESRKREIRHRMLLGVWRLGSVLALITVAADGCRTGTGPDQTGQKVSSKRPRSPEPDNGQAAEKLAAAHAHYCAAKILDEDKQPEAALEEYYQAALADPGDELVVLEVSQRFVESKQPNKALEILVRAGKQPEASGAIFERLGVLYSQAGKVDQAIAASRRAVKESPVSLVAYQTLAANYLQKKQPEEAMKVLDQAARQPNASFEFLVGLSELYARFLLQVPAQKENARAKALAVLQRAEKLSPSTPTLRLQLAEGFNTLGDYTKAAQLYLELIKQLPDVPLLREHVRARLTDIYIRGEDHKGATEQLQAIVREDPTNPQPYYFLGRIAAEDKKPEEAVEYFQKAILLNKDLDQAYYELAIAQMGLNKTSDALATLQKARERFSQSFMLEYLTALAFSRQKAYTEALQHFTAAEVVAQANDPKKLSELFYFEVGSAYERKGDYAQAEKYFERCLQLAPGFAEALNYLGYMWAEHGMKLDKARELIEKALKAEPKNAAYLDSLGWVLFKLNQPKEALPYLLKAVELSPEPDATVYDHLGDAYAALEQPEKAREAWSKSLSVEVSDQVRKKLGAPSPK